MVIFVVFIADIASMPLCPTTPLTAVGPSFDGPRGWSRFIQWVAEARSHRVLCIVVCIWMLNGYDLILTLLSYELGLLHEQNPLARHLLELGTPSILLYKLGLVLIGSYPLLKFRRARIAELGALVILITYASLAVRWSICYDFYALAFPNDLSLAGMDQSVGVLPQ